VIRGILGIICIVGGLSLVGYYGGDFTIGELTIVLLLVGAISYFSSELDRIDKKIKP